MEDYEFMKDYISTLTMSDVIQLIGIMVALLTGIISIIISIVTLRQNSVAMKESSRAQIEIFPFKIYGDPIPRIKIQNFGSSTGTIIDIKVVPEMPDDFVVNPFLYYRDLSLAPNQSFVTVFTQTNLIDVPIKEFDIFYTYTTLHKKIKSRTHINYDFLDASFETSSKSNDAMKALDKINQSIQGLQQR